MSIGYACVHIGSDKTKLSTLRLSGYSLENLGMVIGKNLDALGEIIKYNGRNDIRLYRISSDIIPLASHPANKLNWQVEFKDKLESIGRQIKEADIRVSMHPGQYTVLNSLRPEVVSSAVDDLEYHNGFLDSLGCDRTSKIILHVGGVYSDKSASIERFIGNLNLLSSGTRRRLVIENDDRSYNIEDVMYISERTGLPVVFDNLHHSLNPPEENPYDEQDWIRRVSGTWKPVDGKQKIHYSQSGNNKRKGAHSDTIGIAEFLDFYKSSDHENIDIMLEVKDKNVSALKCIISAQKKPSEPALQKEWARHKYLVMSRSASIYNEIRGLFSKDPLPDPVSFYTLVEKAMKITGDKGSESNAASHVWGYFKKTADARIKAKYLKYHNGYINGTVSLSTLKKFLFRLSQENSVEYLIDSLYFYL